VKLPPAERKLLIAAELYWREHGRGPTWLELRRGLGLSQDEITAMVWTLQWNRLVTFSREPRSLRTTPKGLAAALGKRRP
jgi:hypothetical protein